MARRLVVLVAGLALLTPQSAAFSASAVDGCQMVGRSCSRDVSSRRDVARRLALGVSTFVLSQGAALPAGAQLYVPTDGSELAPIAKDGKPSPVVLVPLLQAQERLEAVAELIESGIESGDTGDWNKASILLKQKPFTPTKELKRLFNAYTDNIYFSDSSRKNMYLDGSAMLGAGQSTFGFGTFSVGNGGASPESKDTFTYLYRNEVLNNVDALVAELAYLIKQAEAGVDESTDDLMLYLKQARDNFNKYLDNIPAQDLQKARNFVKTAPR